MRQTRLQLHAHQLYGKISLDLWYMFVIIRDLGKTAEIVLTVGISKQTTL